MSQTKAQLIDPTDGSIVNADINASAAIAGTKVSPDFGSQNILTTGSVGIGIGSQTPSTPQKQLHIAHDSSPRIMLSNDATGHATPNGTELLLDSGGNFEILQRENLNLEFFTNNSQRMTINGSGDIGIGTTTLNRADAGRPLVQFDYSGSDGSEGVELRLSNSAINGNAATDNAAITYIGQTLGITNRENGTIQFRNNGSERLRIDASGNVGIGTTAPVEKLGVDGGIRLVTENGETNRITSLPSGTYNLGVSGGAAIGFTRTADGGGGSDQIIFETHHQGTSHGERMRIDKSGNVGIGTTTPDAPLVVRNSLAPHTVFKVNSQSESTKFSVQTVQDSDIRVGTQSNHPLAIYVNQLERVRIDTGGRVGIGTSSPGSFNANGDNLVIRSSGNTGLTLSGSTGGFCSINFSNAVDTHVSAAIEYNQGTNELELRAGESDGIVTLRSGSFDRIKCFDSGDIFLGGAAGANTASTSNSRGFVYDNDTTGNNQDGGNHPFIVVQHATKTSGAAAYIAFQSQGAFRGSVVESNLGNNVTYNTSSDYRLKQDEVIISDGITRLKQLKPYQFKWKDDLDYGYVDGFFAHEVGEVVKGAATGTKDEVVTQSGIDNGTYKGGLKVGDPVIQGLDYSRITPLLTAALQEAVAKIETLETEVAALKAA